MDIGIRKFDKEIAMAKSQKAQKLRSLETQKLKTATDKKKDAGTSSDTFPTTKVEPTRVDETGAGQLMEKIRLIKRSFRTCIHLQGKNKSLSTCRSLANCTRLVRVSARLIR
jgi:hypothetical protein